MNPAAGTPVELHIVSDSTGETAARLVLALEAQFPEQEFEEVRHPRVESVDDLALAVNRPKGRPAVIVYTLVKPELRDAMRQLCRSARVHYCDLLGHPIESIAARLGHGGEDEARRAAGAQRAYFKRIEAMEFAVRTTTASAAASARRTSSSSASRALRRRRCRSTSATSATRPRTSRS